MELYKATAELKVRGCTAVLPLWKRLDSGMQRVPRALAVCQGQSIRGCLPGAVLSASGLRSTCLAHHPATLPAGQGCAGVCAAAAGQRAEVPCVWAPHLPAGCHRAHLQPPQGLPVSGAPAGGLGWPGWLAGGGAPVCLAGAVCAATVARALATADCRHCYPAAQDLNSCRLPCLPRSLRFIRIDGKTPPSQRQSLVNKFQENEGGWVGGA